MGDAGHAMTPNMVQGACQTGQSSLQNIIDRAAL